MFLVWEGVLMCVEECVYICKSVFLVWEGVVMCVEGCVNVWEDVPMHVDI